MRSRPIADRDAAGRRQSGFTLVELLVALTLIGMLSVMLFGGLRFGSRSWDAVIDSAAERDRIAATQNFLRSRLESVSVPVAHRGRLSAPTSEIAGDARQMIFTAPWLSALRLGGLYTFELSVDDSDKRQLLLEWHPSAPDADQSDDLTGSRVLLDGIETIDIAYFGIPEDATEPIWRDSWRSSEAMPELIRIHIDFTDPDRIWPTLIIDPKG